MEALEDRIDVRHRQPSLELMKISINAHSSLLISWYKANYSLAKIIKLIRQQ